MKNPKLGDYLLWNGEVAQIIGEASERHVIIELIKDRICPHCSGKLEKEQFSVIVSSPLFQQSAEKLQTLND
jgi:hypothetical protein